jgi:hypothetical protein
MVIEQEAKELLDSQKPADIFKIKGATGSTTPPEL